MKLFTVFVVLLVSLSALASGVSVKGGGSGVEMGARVALLDLVESGVSETPFFGTKECAGVTFEAVTSLAPSSSPVHDLLCRKIYDVASLDPVLATALVKAIASLNWVFTSESLKVIDADPIIDVKTVQLAVRNGNRVIVNRALFGRMSSPNKAALVIHEVAAALISAEVTSPLPVRTLVGNLFRAEYFKRRNHDLLNDLRYFPSRRTMRFNPQGWTYLELPWDSIETPFSMSEGAFFYPCLTALWTDSKNEIRYTEAFYSYDQARSQVEEVLNYCDDPKPDRRLLQVTTTYLNPTVYARFALENGTPTDRYSFDGYYDVKSIIELPKGAPEPCSASLRESLSDLRSWLSTFKPIVLE